MNQISRVILVGSMLLWCAHLTALGQKRDTTMIGETEGTVKDSLYNFFLQNATVAIYRASDSGLISYCLTDRLGVYHFTNLPVGIRLRLIASFMGYQSGVKYFTISKNPTKYFHKTINLNRTEGDVLPEVIVKSFPPVRLNGDTLEFNAQAFTLDKNAVVEDLLKKLPGITVWGDGTITVNGREIADFKVDGKPFILGGTKGAIQNLPKDAVDKIQVYQTSKNRSNQIDSTTEINIKLKKDKNFGHFGKIAAGYGTRSRYQSGAAINYFNPRTQFGLVGNLNNINKVASNINTLMLDNTYKGVGPNLEYNSDFSMSGENKTAASGFTFQHYFIPKTDGKNDNKLNVDYFFNDNVSTTLGEVQTLRTLGNDINQKQFDSNSAQLNSKGHSFSSRYNKVKNGNSINLAASFYTTKNATINSQTSSTYVGVDTLQSTNYLHNESQNKSSNLMMSGSFTHQRKPYSRRRFPESYTIDYAFTQGKQSGFDFRNTNFIFLTDTLQNKNFNRHYNTASTNTNQTLNFDLPYLSKLFSSNPNFMASIETKFHNKLEVSNSDAGNQVTDYNIDLSQYLPNNNLTNNSRYVTVNERPVVNFSRNFYRGLANRYNKNLTTNLNVEVQYYFQKNRSDLSFQTFSHQYKKFIPSIAISYQNYQLGVYEDNYSLNFSKTAGYPTVEQLYPLVDSSNSYYLSLGNEKLRPYDKNEISFKFNHVSFAAKNTFNYDLSLTAGQVNNFFADSLITDAAGRTKHYTINMDGYKYINSTGSLNKAYKLNKCQLQLQFGFSAGLAETPNSVNNITNYSDVFNSNSNLNVNFTFADFLATAVSQKYSYFYLRQGDLHSDPFNNSYWTTSISTSLNCTKRIRLGTNINYNYASSSASNSVNYTLWNAEATCRMFSSNNLECRFSALDLLHQNKGVTNSGYNNVIIQSRTNVLQQYFMLTISFYPRQFGKRTSKSVSNTNAAEKSGM